MSGITSSVFDAAANLTSKFLGNGQHMPLPSDLFAARNILVFLASVINCILNFLAWSFSTIFAIFASFDSYMAEHPLWFAYDILKKALLLTPSAIVGWVLGTFARIGPWWLGGMGDI